MALSFLSGAGNRSSAKHFDIRLDNDYVVFRGNVVDAASVALRGKVVLCLSEPLSIKYIRLTLAGLSKVANGILSTSSKKAVKEQPFFEKTWNFRDIGKSKSEVLQAGNYEYPFDIVLEGSLPESVEGLPDSFVIYRFKAEIGRKFAKDIVVRKPLRIIRTLNTSALDLVHAMSISNIWTNKLEYAISTPSKAVIYGTSIQAEFRLVSLLKGLRIGRVTTEVVESQEFTLNPEAVSPYMNPHRVTRVVASDHYTVPEEPDLLDEEAEGYKFSRHVELPKSLTQCVQDADTRGIKIRHRLKFNVQLHNPDEHMSELRATLPVLLYISPLLAINDNNELIDQTRVAARRAVETEVAHQAPPLYEHHRLDHLYSDVDMSGYRTTGNFSTPGTPFETHSRNLSSENILLDASTPGGSALAETVMGAADVSAAALRTRLQNLRSRPTSVASEGPPRSCETSPEASRSSSGNEGGQNADYFSSGDATRRSESSSSAYPSRPATPGRVRNPSGTGSYLSQRTSDEDYLPPGSGAQTPGPQSHEVEDLSRVPSYSTAIRISARTPFSGSDLPSYGAAILRTTNFASSPPSVNPRVPATDAGDAIRSATSFSARELRLPGRPAPMGTVATGRTIGEIQDEERRFRLMQARGSI